MSDRDSFDALDYLQHRFGDLNDQRATYVLGQLHRVLNGFMTKKINDGELKVLDFGSGPVVQNSISAAAFASEIVFSDISSSNREAIQKWLDGDADAFNWSPHFDYVVQTLEGKGEKEAREREQRMRKLSKVVFCDALSEHPWRKAMRDHTTLFYSAHVLNVPAAIERVSSVA
ncbi:Nicotinamide N-methyltransferase [Geodia barretti]|uniref:Nicotinamide N-methyltransferase n=1 Tax=Geodia barretti TaxID=519541 RepID=A0AA35WJZ5_GEOBA|nr:Nicotinamide N-methyltransferase [Geodia barretti]